MRQVVTELDQMNAVFDYIVDQLEGRFPLEYSNPEAVRTFRALVARFNSPFSRLDETYMQADLLRLTQLFMESLALCLITGCSNDEKHVALRDCIDLFLDARRLSVEWLKGQGVVPGQSAN